MWISNSSMWDIYYVSMLWRMSIPYWAWNIYILTFFVIPPIINSLRWVCRCRKLHVRLTDVWKSIAWYAIISVRKNCTKQTYHPHVQLLRGQRGSRSSQGQERQHGHQKQHVRGGIPRGFQKNPRNHDSLRQTDPAEHARVERKSRIRRVNHAETEKKCARRAQTDKTHENCWLKRRWEGLTLFSDQTELALSSLMSTPCRVKCPWSERAGPLQTMPSGGDRLSTLTARRENSPKDSEGGGRDEGGGLICASAPPWRMANLWRAGCVIWVFGDLGLRL